MKEVDIIDALKGSMHQSQADVSLSIGDDGAIIDLDHTKQMVNVTDAISADALSSWNRSRGYWVSISSS